jgi:uncharacterized membrane protein YgaE (UPF0421/DUF939 family)
MERITNTGEREMIFKNGRPTIYALITALASITTTTLGHYAEIWQYGYFIGFGFAAVSGLLIAIIDTEL